MITVTKYEHTTLVLQFEKKNFSATRSGLLEGLAPKSAKELNEFGRDGWELVSVLPFSSGSAVMIGTPGTDAAVGFFKRNAA